MNEKTPTLSTEIIPTEIWYKAFGFLQDKKTFKSIRLVNKHLREITENDDYAYLYNLAGSPDREYSFSPSQKNIFNLPAFGTALVQLPNNRLICAAVEKNLYIIDIISCETIKKIEAHEQSITALLMGGKNLIVSASKDKKIKIWSLPSLELVQEINAHKNTVSCLATNGKKIISGDWNSLIYSCDFCKKEMLSTENSASSETRFEGHDSWVRDIAVINPLYFASASNDKSVRLWNIENKKNCVKVLTDTKAIVASYFCKLIAVNNHLLIAGSGNGYITIWDINKNDNDPIFSRQVHKKQIACLIALTDSIFISACENKQLKLWSYTSKENKFKLISENSLHSCIKSILKLDSGNLLFCNEKKELFLWGFPEKKALLKLNM